MWASLEIISGGYTLTMYTYEEAILYIITFPIIDGEELIWCRVVM